MLTLLLAAAGCTGADVVVDPGEDAGDAARAPDRGERRPAGGPSRGDTPAMHLDYHLRGDGLDEAKARRAIELSITKYCSVIHSLAPDIRITHGLTLG